MSDSAAVSGVTVEFNVPARMRDGVTLRANVYRPAGDGPWPTLLTRTPYNKNDLQYQWFDPVQTAAQGFMVVVQDTRGRFTSEGEWIPLYFEREDGYDTVEWAARLPGSNGRVGMYGLSYMAVTQWTAALEQAPSLAAIAPAMTPADYLDGTFERGGAVEVGIVGGWTLMMACAHLERLPLSDAERSERLSALLDDLDRLPTDGFWGVPAQELPVLARHGAPEARWFDGPEVIARCQVAGEYERVTVPSLHVGGWYDVFSQAVLDSYGEMAALGRPARLIVGPWTHDTHADPVGELCFGARASRVGVPGYDVNEEQLEWYRRYLLGESTAADAERPPVRIFVMGRNEWRDEASWPLARARDERWFLLAGGDLRDDGPPADDEVTEFVYDPSDPVPSLGGQTMMLPWVPGGPCDQSRIEARDDVCVFTSAVLAGDLEVTGRVRVVLHAESSAPSTDWVARLCDVHPDGRSFNICDGIVRVAKDADSCGEVEIDLWSTSNVFLAGHRLRVHVTSSSFPRWERNLNTGNQREARVQTARQRVHHSSARPSWIELPIIDGPSGP